MHVQCLRAVCQTVTLGLWLRVRSIGDTAKPWAHYMVLLSVSLCPHGNALARILSGESASVVKHVISLALLALC